MFDSCDADEHAAPTEEEYNYCPTFFICKGKKIYQMHRLSMLKKQSPSRKVIAYAQKRK